MKKLTNLLLTLLLISLFSCQNKKANLPVNENNEQIQEQQQEQQEQLQGQVEHKYKYVCSLSGITIRFDPEVVFDPSVKERLKLYDKVEVFRETSELEEINNVKSYWFDIKYGKVQDCIFGGYLVDTLEEARKAEYFDGLWIRDKREQTEQDTINNQVKPKNERINVDFCGYDYEKNKLIFRTSYDNYETVKTIDDLKMIITDGMKKYIRKYVCFPNEVCVRNSPDENAEIVGSLKNYAVVSVLEKTSDLKEINNVKAYWFNVESEDVSGWVFGGYLVDTLEEAKKAEYVNGTWIGDKLVFEDKENYSKETDIDNEQLEITYYGYDYETNDQIFKIKYNQYELFQPIDRAVRIYYYEWSNVLFKYMLFVKNGVEMYFEKIEKEFEFDFEKEEQIDGYCYNRGFTLKKIKD